MIAAGAAALAVMLLATATAEAQTRPDLSGLWANGVVPDEAYKPVDPTAPAVVAPYVGANERNSRDGQKGLARMITTQQDLAIRNRGWLIKPPYRPELWDEVRLRDIYGNAGGEWIEYADPTWLNHPPGVPRMGPPSRIIQTADRVTLLYQQGNIFRDIPTDCRPHNEVLSYDVSFMGHAIGCWHGEALVITSKGFTDQTWLEWPGYFHSTEMEVIEIFRRQGDRLLYDVTVIDPVVFTRPYTMNTRVLVLNADPRAMLIEEAPYDERTLGTLTAPTYRG